MRSIGIYPGTFDPVHAGHIAFANAARAACNLDVIYFIPELSPRGKTNVTEIRTRVELLREALSKSPKLEILTLQSERFTVNETMPEIEVLLGSAAYTLLTGSDVARSIAKWPESNILLATWNVAIGMRNNDNAEHIEPIFKQLEQDSKISIHRTYVYTDKPELSSSQFRSTNT